MAGSAQQSRSAPAAAGGLQSVVVMVGVPGEDVVHPPPAVSFRLAFLL
jgi:hypothetical protein